MFDETNLEVVEKLGIGCGDFRLLQQTSLPVLQVDVGDVPCQWTVHFNLWQLLISKSRQDAHSPLLLFGAKRISRNAIENRKPGLDVTSDGQRIEFVQGKVARRQ